MGKLTLTFLFAFVTLSHGVTLQSLIDEALRSSPLLSSKKLEVRKEEANRKSLEAKKFGEIKVFLRGVRYEDKRILYPLTPPIDPRNLVGAENQFHAGVSYTLPLFTGFELRRRAEIGQILKEIKEIDYRLTKNRLVFNLTSVYLKILELKRTLKALEAYRESLEKLHADVKLGVEIGRRAEVDLYKVIYQLESAKAEIEKVENSLHSLKQVIIYLVGREDLDLSEFEEVEISKDVQMNQVEGKVEELEIVKRALLRREIARKKVDIERGKYLPKVFLNASLQRNMGGGEYKDLWNVGLTVEMTLFDFGNRAGRYIGARAELRKTELEYRNLKLEIKKDLAKALSRIKTAQATVRSAKKKLEFARKVEEAEEAKYREGVSDMFDLLYAKAQKLMAETQYYRAIYEKERAVAYLRFLLEEFKDE